MLYDMFCRRQINVFAVALEHNSQEKYAICEDD